MLTPVFRLATHKLASGTARALQLWPLSSFAATWLHISIWRFAAWIPGWPSHDSSALWAPVQLVLAIFFSALISRWLDRACDDVEPLAAAEEPSGTIHVLPHA
jgi:hypothetical protein